jgi:hypothetical protein
MHCNHLPSPGLCNVFKLGIDRANEVELLFAPPAFALFFPGDGCANAFVTLKAEQAIAAIGRSETFQRALLMLHDAQIQVAGEDNVSVPVWLPRMQKPPDMARSSSSCSRPQGKTVTAPQGAGFGGRKAPNGIGKKASSGSFDSAPSSAVSHDKSVRRSAQDDDFVGVLKKNIPNKLTHMGCSPG